MAIEIVDLTSYKMVIFHSYVSLPEGTSGKNMGVTTGKHTQKLWKITIFHGQTHYKW